jgi:hypothetical protein
VARRREAVDAPDGCAASSGVRPGRRPPPALQDGRQGRRGKRSGQGIDGASSACCAQGPHATLGAIRRPRIQDGRGREGIALGLHAGSRDGQERGSPAQGRPHGSGLAPLAANVDWPEGLETGWATVGHAHCRGHVVLSRAAAEGLIGGEWAEDARRITDVRPHRCAQ